jgi:large subunit ribosomal protein L15
VNVSDLDKRFNDGDTVNLETLMAAGLIKKSLDGLKVLGNGEITKKLTVEAAIFSASAKEKIEAVGGKTEVV